MERALALGTVWCDEDTRKMCSRAPQPRPSQTPTLHRRISWHLQLAEGGERCSSRERELRYHLRGSGRLCYDCVDFLQIADRCLEHRRALHCPQNATSYKS